MSKLNLTCDCAGQCTKMEVYKWTDKSGDIEIKIQEKKKFIWIFLDKESVKKLIKYIK